MQRRFAFVFLCGATIEGVLSIVGNRECRLVRVYAASAEPGTAHLTIDYPEDGSIFPPDIAPPTVTWHDGETGNQIDRFWEIEVAFSDGSKPLRIQSLGEKPVIGEIDPRCVAKTNEVPTLSVEQAAAHTWIPAPSVWEQIKKHSIEQTATITIRGFADKTMKQPGSQGQVTVKTSKDPVGAPIFYRDVPLMPTEGKRAVISPIDPRFVGLITWRLKNIGQPGSRQLITGFHTCANCHSFSRDGKTMGADLDARAWQQIAGALDSIEFDERGASGHDAFAHYARSIIGQVFERLGWEPKPGESPDTQHLRRTLILEKRPAAATPQTPRLHR